MFSAGLIVSCWTLRFKKGTSIINNVKRPKYIKERYVHFLKFIENILFINIPVSNIVFGLIGFRGQNKTDGSRRKSNF